MIILSLRLMADFMIYYIYTCLNVLCEFVWANCHLASSGVFCFLFSVGNNVCARIFHTTPNA